MACLETVTNISEVETITLADGAISDDRFAAAYPTSVSADLFVRDDFTSLNGRWKEWRKKKEAAVSIMSRLGIGAIKRRLVSNRSNEYELYLSLESLPGASDRDGATSLSTSPGDEGGLRKSLSSADATSNECSTIVAKEACLSPTNDSRTRVPSEGVTTAGTPLESPRRRASLSIINPPKAISGILVSHFPLKRFLKDVFTADGETFRVAQDPETGDWDSITTYRDGMLMHRRVSPKYPGITLYETLAIIPSDTIIFKQEDDEVSAPAEDGASAGALVAPADSGISDDDITTMTPPPLSLNPTVFQEVTKMTPEQEKAPLMYFQWKLVDENMAGDNPSAEGPVSSDTLAYECFCTYTGETAVADQLQAM